MLEVLYDVTTKEVRAWNADMSVKGNLKPKEGQKVVILPVDPPDFESDVYYVDLAEKKVVGNSNYIPPPPPRDLANEIDDLKAKLEELERRWEDEVAT